MTTVATLVTEIRGKDVNATALVDQYMARLRQADATATRTAGSIGGLLASGQQRAANSALSLAQAQARLAVAQGNAAGAIGILNSALGANAGASERALVGVQTQAARLQSGTTAFQQFGAAASSSLLGLVGPAAAAGAALGALSAVMGQAVAGFKLQASLDASRASITALLRGVRDSSVVFREAQAFAAKYKLTQAELNETLTSSVGVMRASNASTTELFETLSRLQVLAPEKPISEAARALRELQSGDTTSIKELFNIAAKDANRMKVEIQGGADAVQVVSQFLTTAGVGMDALAIKTQGAAGKMRELAVVNEQFQLALGGGAGGPGLALLEARITATSGATRILTGDATAMGQSLATAADQGSGAFSVLAGVFPGLGAALQQASTAALGFQATQVELASTANAAVAPAFAQLNAIISAGIPVAAQSAAVTTQHAIVQSQLRDETVRLTQATTINSNAMQVAAVDAQTAAVADAQLAQSAQIAANALLAAGAAGAATAARLANSSSLIDVMTAAFYRLAAAKQAASVDIASGRPEAGGDAIARSLGAAARNQGFAAVQAERAAAAQQAQVRALGSQAEKVKSLQSEYAKAARIFGAGSAEAISAETALLQAQQKGAAGGRKAHAAAGAGRISDTQKLQNTLLADEEKFNDQSEEAERAHQQKIIDIEAEFLRKSLEQQRANEVSKRQSRADFYDSLTSATRDVGPQIAAGLSAAYEAAYAEAQAIAQAGNAKLAADYLALKEEQISAELEFQKKLASAREAGDKAEVSRLEAIHKLRQDAAGEEEKQLLAGGDANVKDREAALSDEARSFAEQQVKIGNSADAAAERKINAALRSGKAVEAENLRLQQQEAILNRIGTRGAAAPPVGTGAAPLPAAGTPTSAAAPALDLSALAGQLQAIVDAIHTQTGSVTSAQRETTGAVRGLGERSIR